MQSHLTRRVFRAILNNEPLSSTHCRNRLIHTIRRPRSQRLLVLSSPNYVQRRGLFAFNMAEPADPRPASLPAETGLKPMRDLMRALKDKSRGPTNDLLTKAFQDFFAVRVASPGVITGFQARLLSITWKHLQAQKDELDPEEWQAVFSTESLENMLFVLAETTCLPESREVVQKVARFAYLELCADEGFGPNQISRPALVAYVNIQALTGNPEEARHVVESFWSRLHSTSPSPWLTVMRGFATNNDRQQLRQTVEMLDEFGVRFDSASQEGLVEVLVKQDLFEAVKAIFECPMFDRQESTIAAKKAAIRHAILHSEKSWAESIYQSLSQASPAETLSITLLWEAAHGKDAAGIADTVRSLLARAPETKESIDISCVNLLLEYANSLGNPDLAADFCSLAAHWGLEPDVQTRLLQLESRIEARDINGTLQCLQDLRDFNSVVLGDLPLMNKLVTMLCLSGQEDAVFDQVSAFLDPLFEGNVRLESETLAALTRMLLYRHDWDGVSELLRPRLALYESEERARIRNALTDFIKDDSQDSAHAWEAYELLRLAFPETGVGMRTEIMTSFFNRERGDLAFLVFGHMRQAEEFSRRPKPDTYAKCFQGIARTRDANNLDFVHNMLKLDVEVDLNTQLLNRLMLAYTACDMPEKSMKVFREILQSAEGPTHKTVAIFFKMCAKHHNGVQEAMKMMGKIRLLGIEMDRRLYISYVEALAAQCEFGLATKALESMHSEIGQLPTKTSIAHLYNAIPYQYWKDEVEKWARAKYPELWARLESIERTEHEEGLMFEVNSNEIFV
ncbi:putative mitochondrial respiratory complex I chaperone (Cia84) [Aspergillus affinis]|uniref:putative mitochondrial respiratory complex I chaperone (Cia84) n=1 Tax=Aspergillus affinis TaxID=1070780 RepID=UPI0022FE4E95|nr:uncharacterized protein KD926_010423 [Aspergillus affinis]KAI9045100.1 hypothetical protein KD926_010423 [Aspergillus affinis]